MNEANGPAEALHSYGLSSLPCWSSEMIERTLEALSDDFGCLEVPPPPTFLALCPSSNTTLHDCGSLQSSSWCAIRRCGALTHPERETGTLSGRPATYLQKTAFSDLPKGKAPATAAAEGGHGEPPRRRSAPQAQQAPKTACPRPSAAAAPKAAEDRRRRR